MSFGAAYPSERRDTAASRSVDRLRADGARPPLIISPSARLHLNTGPAQARERAKSDAPDSPRKRHLAACRRRRDHKRAGDDAIRNDLYTLARNREPSTPSSIRIVPVPAPANRAHPWRSGKFEVLDLRLAGSVRDRRFTPRP